MTFMLLGRSWSSCSFCGKSLHFNGEEVRVLKDGAVYSGEACDGCSRLLCTCETCRFWTVDEGACGPTVTVGWCHLLKPWARNVAEARAHCTWWCTGWEQRKIFTLDEVKEHMGDRLTRELKSEDGDD